MASTTTPPSRESHKKLKPKPKTESKSWQTRNMARKEKQAEHAAKLAAKTEEVEGWRARRDSNAGPPA